VIGLPYLSFQGAAAAFGVGRSFGGRPQMAKLRLGRKRQ
jgi:hypothetical protein